MPMEIRMKHSAQSLRSDSSVKDYDTVLSTVPGGYCTFVVVVSAGVSLREILMGVGIRRISCWIRVFYTFFQICFSVQVACSRAGFNSRFKKKASRSDVLIEGVEFGEEEYHAES